MGGAFRLAVSTGVRRILNLAGDRVIPRLAGGPTTSHTASLAEEPTTKNQAA
jgi:hypothetical protein